MCSSRWEIPACSSRSATEPVAIQEPSATERTLGTRSVTTRTPGAPPAEPAVNVVIRCSGCSAPSIAIAAGARAAGAALTITARTPLGALASVAPGAIARGATAAASTRADTGELLRGLARDVRVVGQAQADAAALAIDLDHAHVDLVAFVEHVLDALHALSRRDVRDVQQSIGALRQLDEGAEGRRLDGFPGVLVADLDLLHHQPHALDERVAELAVCGVD